MSALPRIRPVATTDPAEVDSLYDICLRTGDGGKDATALYGDPRLLGEVYLGAYLQLEPDLAFVLDSPDGPLGYVLGARDTLAFEAACQRSWWPQLRERYPLGRFPKESPDERLVRLMHSPHPADPAVVGEYPAHLHIDILPAGQGGGNGRRLMEHLLEALRTAGAPGVHLGVATANRQAVGFYQHLGFTRLQGDEHGLTLGLRL